MKAGRLAAASVLVLMAAAGTGCSADVDGSVAQSQSQSQSLRPSVAIPSDPAAAFAAAKAQLGRESSRFAQDTTSDLLDFTGIVNAETR